MRNRVTQSEPWAPGAAKQLELLKTVAPVPVPAACPCPCPCPCCLSLSCCLCRQMIQQGTNNVYPEVEGLSVLLGFKTQNAGCCKVSAPACACWGWGGQPRQWAAWLGHYQQCVLVSPPAHMQPSQPTGPHAWQHSRQQLLHSALHCQHVASTTHWCCRVPLLPGSC